MTLQNLARQFATRVANILAHLLFLAVLSVAPLAHGQWTRDDLTKMDNGDAVSEFVDDTATQAHRLRAAINIQAPVDVVWNVMRGCERAPEFIPNLVGCRVLEVGDSGHYDIRENRTRGFGPIPGASITFRSEYTTDPHEIRVQHMSGGVSDMHGTWRFEPIQGGRATRLHYDFSIITGLPLPAFIERPIFRRQSLGNLLAIRDESQRIVRTRLQTENTD